MANHLALSSSRRMMSRPTAERGPVREFLAISLASQLYGVELTQIREILSPPPLTVVPRAARYVLGICSVRGQLTTVVELNRLLSLPEGGATRRARILLSECRGEVVGFFVDEVRQVIRLSEGEVEYANAALGGEAPEHVIGIGRPGNEVLILLDLERTLFR
ncbi:MAG TPA: chemotaxis protein CheW [Polyangiaceae bacterium]|nr:chemotaxis protein CheW [Polyangiaceae bacterium]